MSPDKRAELETRTCAKIEQKKMSEPAPEISRVSGGFPERRSKSGILEEAFLEISGSRRLSCTIVRVEGQRRVTVLK